jgi:hypothetical protein
MTRSSHTCKISAGQAWGRGDYKASHNGKNFRQWLYFCLSRIGRQFLPHAVIWLAKKVSAYLAACVLSSAQSPKISPSLRPIWLWRSCRQLLGFPGKVRYSGIALPTLKIFDFLYPIGGKGLPRSSPWRTPLPGGAGLGSLSSTALRYPGSGGKGMHKIQRKTSFFRKVVLLCRRREDSAASIKTLGYFSRAQRPQKLFFNCGGQLPHNLG